MSEVCACVGFLCMGSHWEISRCVWGNLGVGKMLPGIFSWKGAGRISTAKVEKVAAVNGNGSLESYKEVEGLDYQIGLLQCLAGVCKNHSFGCWTGSVWNLSIKGNGGFSPPPFQLTLPEQEKFLCLCAKMPCLNKRNCCFLIL